MLYHSSAPAQRYVVELLLRSCIGRRQSLRLRVHTVVQFAAEMAADIRYFYGSAPVFHPFAPNICIGTHTRFFQFL